MASLFAPLPGPARPETVCWPAALTYMRIKKKRLILHSPEFSLVCCAAAAAADTASRASSGRGWLTGWMVVYRKSKINIEKKEGEAD